VPRRLCSAMRRRKGRRGSRNRPCSPALHLGDHEKQTPLDESTVERRLQTTKL